MPLQHASASVLKRMKRGASGDIFLKLLEKIRRTIPGVVHSHQLHRRIPRRNRSRFRRAVQFVEAAQFDRLGVFSFSDEDTAKSFHLDGKVDGRTIENRKRKLMAIQKKISRAKNRKLIGREFPVLVEGPSEETDLLWEGRMPSQAPEIDGVCYINDLGEGDAAPGQFRRLRITEAHDYDLVGELVDVGPVVAVPAAGSVPNSRQRMKCPICKKPVEMGCARLPILLGAMPVDRSRQLGPPKSTSSPVPSSPKTNRMKVRRSHMFSLHLVRLRSGRRSRPAQ